MIKASKVKFYALATLPMLFWGVAYVWVKVVFKYYGPITTTFLRLLVSGSLLLIYLLLKANSERRRANREIQNNKRVNHKFKIINSEDYAIFLLLATIDPLGYFLCESIGLTRVSALIGSIIISTIPVFTALLGYFMLKEKLTPLNFFGVFLSFTGLGVMLLKLNMTLTASPTGVLLMLGAVVFAVIYSIIIKSLADKYSPVTIVAVQNCLGAIYFLPIFLIFEYRDFIKVTPNFELVSNLILLTIFSSIFAFVIYIRIVREIGIGKANMFVNLISIFTLLASYYILDEQLNVRNVIGMLIVIAGLYLSQIVQSSKLKVQS